MDNKKKEEEEESGKRRETSKNCFSLVLGLFSCYAYLMELVFVPSAFKHNFTEEDIRHAYKTIIYDGLLEGYKNKFAFVGFNRAGNPIEVFYNPIGEDMIRVFHSMIARDNIIEQIR